MVTITYTGTELNAIISLATIFFIWLFLYNKKPFVHKMGATISFIILFGLMIYQNFNNDGLIGIGIVGLLMSAGNGLLLLATSTERNKNW